MMRRLALASVVAVLAGSPAAAQTDARSPPSTRSGVNAALVTFTARGAQLVAVAVGGNALFGSTQGDLVIAFELPE